MMSPYKYTLSVQTLVVGRLNINLYHLPLNAVNVPIKYFVSHFLLPSPD